MLEYPDKWQAMMVVIYTHSSGMFQLYEEMGIRGKVKSDDVDGIADWVRSFAGTQFASDGFAEYAIAQSLSPAVAQDNDDVRDNIISIMDF